MPKIENLTNDRTTNYEYTHLGFKELLIAMFLIGSATLVASCVFFIPLIYLIPYLCR